MRCTHVHTHTSQPQHSHKSILASYTIPDVIETCATTLNQMGMLPSNHVGCVMLKRGTAGANSTRRVGLVERSILLSRLCFSCSRAQLNNKRTTSTASVNVGHFVTRSGCVTISTYDAHCLRISKTSVNVIDAHSMHFQHAFTVEITSNARVICKTHMHVTCVSVFCI